MGDERDLTARPTEDHDTRLTRRAALARAGGGAAVLGTAWLAAACGGSSSSGGPSSSASKGSGVHASSDPSIPLASKGRPVTLPIYSDNKPIPSGRSPEKGPLVIYDWSDYLSPAVVKSFEQRYGVSAQVTNFASIDEAINKIASGAVKADVWVPDANRVLQLAQAKLIQPINHSYIPNLDNAIPAAADPFYDRGARYSTPNFINLYGIGWRNDLIKIDPGSLSNPWDVFWQVPSDTPIGLVNADPEDALLMAYLRDGAKNFDSWSHAQIEAATAALQKLKGAKWQYTAFQPLASRIEKLAYCFNGDMVQIPHYLPKGTPLSSVSFYFPPNGHGYIINDMWVIPRHAAHPVLAHLFMNHFLELESAIANFRDEGYQTMLKGLTKEKLKAAKVAPAHAIDMAFATPEMQANGLPAPTFNSSQLQWIEQAFAQLTAG
ncbi:MAG TPA: extracellular solute-binding protein [Solirubrobacteraceae bacterium]|jgi:spermidine/putrescine transport system substrate-binding protein|nr:extracellular solute-binding protein [Solirubrobacteraceae bacterium]